MTMPQPAPGLQPWSASCRFGFRVILLFLVLHIVPLDPKFYASLFRLNWTDLHVFDILQLTRYLPVLIPIHTPADGFWNSVIILVLSLAGAFIWTRRDNGRTPEYNNLYYWLRALVRYRLAIGVIAYGLIKFFPLQIPYPSLSSLHTNYGDFLPWKIYYHTIGIVPWYESFLGAVEIVAGILLLFRATATFGAGILTGFLLNIFAANLAYSIGEQIYAGFLLLLAVFVLAHDVPRLYRLLFQEKTAIADHFEPWLPGNWAGVLSRTGRAAMLLFILGFGYAAYSAYSRDPYLLPKTPGLQNAYGYYSVDSFAVNNSPSLANNLDTTRWQNVVFEKWSTISIYTGGRTQLDTSYGDSWQEADLRRNYELAGTGGRQYYHYNIDSLHQRLVLENKNPNYAGKKLYLQYSRPDSTTIILSGRNEHQDSIHAVLTKVNKRYLFFVGRRQPLKL